MGTAARSRANRVPADERRNEIVTRATTLFAEKGFYLTTMDDIAEAAGITKRTLYRYVASKDELLYDIHDLFSGLHLIPQTSGAGDPVDALTEAVRAHVGVVMSNQTAIAVFLDERKHLTGSRWRLIEQRRNAYELHVAGIVARGVDDRVFRDVIPRPVTQALLGGLTEVFRRVDPAGPFTVEELSAEQTSLFLDGVVTDRTVELRPAVTSIPASAQRHRAAAAGRERVREAATTAFARHGYHATSMRDLAQAAGTTKGAVMYHAGYKHDLLEQIHVVTFEDSIEILERIALEPHVDPVDLLYQLIVGYMDFVAENRDAVHVVNENMRYLEPEAFARVAQLRTHWRRQFIDAIEGGIAEGVLRAVNPAVLTMTISGVLNSAARWYSAEGALRPEAIAEMYARLVLLGLRRP